MLDLSGDPAAGRGFGRSLLDQAIGEFMLDVAHHVPVIVTATDVQKHEAVQCIAVTCRMGLGVHDAVSGTTEEADESGKQVALILGVNHDFDAMAMRVDARFDHRVRIGYPVVQGARVPCDFFSRVAQEVDGVRVDSTVTSGRLIGDAEKAQQSQGFFRLS